MFFWISSIYYIITILSVLYTVSKWANTTDKNSLKENWYNVYNIVNVRVIRDKILLHKSKSENRTHGVIVIVLCVFSYVLSVMSLSRLINPVTNTIPIGAPTNKTNNKFIFRHIRVFLNNTEILLLHLSFIWDR